jgi:hypothetical protein
MLVEKQHMKAVHYPLSTAVQYQIEELTLKLKAKQNCSDEKMKSITLLTITMMRSTGNATCVCPALYS